MIFIFFGYGIFWEAFLFYSLSASSSSSAVSSLPFLINSCSTAPSSNAYSVFSI
jgi:hypothetical protein